MNKYVYIYLIRHPYLNEGYIGQSCNPPRRFKEHMRDKKATPKTDWLRELQNDYLKPQLEILERVRDDEVFVREKETTKQYLINGWSIMNSTNRGIGGDYKRVTKWRTLNDL